MATKAGTICVYQLILHARTYLTVRYLFRTQLIHLNLKLVEHRCCHRHPSPHRLRTSLACWCSSFGSAPRAHRSPPSSLTTTATWWFHLHATAVFIWMGSTSWQIWASRMWLMLNNHPSMPCNPPSIRNNRNKHSQTLFCRWSRVSFKQWTRVSMSNFRPCSPPSIHNNQPSTISNRPWTHNNRQ